MTDARNGPVLVVDDEIELQRSVARILERAGYECLTAGSATEALSLLAETHIPLVLTDMNMPGDSGLVLLGDIRDAFPSTATIMIAGEDSAQLAELALDVGAYGYLVKPFRPTELVINVSNAFRRRSLELQERTHRQRLEEMIRERTSNLWTALQSLEKREKDLRVSREATIERLTVAAGFRDDETACHIQRMSRYCGLLSTWAGLDHERSEMMRTASVMHDVGKIGIPDSILLKPGKLTPDEYAYMQQHADFGYRILSGGKSELLDLAATIARTHHEKCDGSGYPRGLKRDDIPLEGRIAAVADVFDALTTNRIYRKAFTLPEAVQIMKEGKGSHFDAELLDLFLANLDEVVRAGERDEPSSLHHAARR